MRMKTTTDLRIDYAHLTWDYEFPPEIELALESDYIVNQYLYDEDAIKHVATLLFIAPGATTECVLATVRNCWSVRQLSS